MSKIDLFSVLSLLEGGDEDAAREAIHEWLVALGQTAQDSSEVIAEGNDMNWQGEEVHGEDLEDEGDEAGEGDHAEINDTSTTPSPANRDPEAACAVEINAEEHHGFDLESAPPVKDAPGPHFVDFDLDDLDEISKEGDSSAMLNSGEGFGNDSPPSPIAGEEGSAAEAPKAAPKAEEPKDDAEPVEPKADESKDDESEEEEKKEDE